MSFPRDRIRYAEASRKHRRCGAGDYHECLGSEKGRRHLERSNSREEYVTTKGGENSRERERVRKKEHRWKIPEAVTGERLSR